MSYYDLSHLQQQNVGSVLEEMDRLRFVKKCSHSMDTGVTGVTNREYCLRCGKVLDEPLSEFERKYE